MSLILASVSAAYLFLDQRLAFCLVLACVTIPTDMAPAARLLTDERVPKLLRYLLNTESGYNDGVVAPIFVFALAFYGTSEEHRDPYTAFEHVLPHISFALLVGASVGAISALLCRYALKRELTTLHYLSIGVLAIPLLAYTITIGLEGNGFIASFVAGLVFRAVQGPSDLHELELTAGVATFGSMALWFILGQLTEFILTSEFHPEAWIFASSALPSSA